MNQNNMTNLKIIPPEGYEIDKEKSTFEKIVFKPIDTRPKSWEEYWKNNFKNKTFQGVNFAQGIVDDKNATFHCSGLIHQIPMNIELTEAFLAMMQLMSLRQAWIGDWKPDWRNQVACVCYILNAQPYATLCSYSSHSLSFPTLEMAEEFLNCFEDLIKIAKTLL